MGSRRRLRLAVCGAVLVGVLGGCFVYDAANPQIWYHNLTDQKLVVTIERPDGPGPRPWDRTEASRWSWTGATVRRSSWKTEEGEPIGRVDEPACAGWSLTINEDYSLTCERA